MFLFTNGKKMGVRLISGIEYRAANWTRDGGIFMLRGATNQRAVSPLPFFYGASSSFKLFPASQTNHIHSLLLL